MKTVEFNWNDTGVKVYVNPDKVTYFNVDANRPGQVQIHFGEHAISVLEKLDDVQYVLEHGQRKSTPEQKRASREAVANLAR